MNKIISLMFIMLVFSYYPATATNVDETKVNQNNESLFSKILVWFKDLFSALKEAEEAPEQEIVPEPKREEKLLPSNKEPQITPKLSNGTCLNCNKTNWDEWTQQECFDENFVCPPTEYLNCMPSLPPEQGKFCYSCKSWVIEKCNMTGEIA